MFLDIKNGIYMPETSYFLDNYMSLEKIIRAKEDGNPLVAHIVMYNCELKSIIVDLGNSFQGIIPLDEFSIYPIMRRDETIGPEIYFRIGKNVCVSVKDILADGTIILSRKTNMLKAFNYFSHCENEVVNCSITSIEHFGVFVDIGHGITGLISRNLFVTARIKTAYDLGFYVGQSLNVEIKAVNVENYQISLSYKNLFDNLAYVLSYSDIIEGIALLPVNENLDGYFVYLNPNTSALMDVPEGLTVPYGTKIVAFVKRFSPSKPDKVRLNFLSFVD